jgi:uncharacterized YccA/Bax inhibitor family protein
MWILLLGCIGLFFGALLTFSPNGLIKMSEGLNRMVTKIDEQVLKYHTGVGICLIGAGAFLLFSFYLLYYRLGH